MNKEEIINYIKEQIDKCYVIEHKNFEEVDLSKLLDYINNLQEEINKLTSESTEWENRTYYWQDKAEVLQEENEKIKLENKVLKEQMVAMVQPNYTYGITLKGDE